MNKHIDSKKPSTFFKAQEIIPKDDTYHSSSNIINIEWWYFDAVFDNGISLHLGIRLYHISNIGIVQTRVNIYKKGILIKETLKVNLTSDFSIENEYPTISINNNKIVHFNTKKYHQTKQYEYQIKKEIQDVIVDLTFTGKTDGWKVETSSTNWAVPLPSASVKGTLSYENKKIPVKGIGYHDHNWGYAPTTVMKNLGWYWGRITSETLNLTWAKLIETEKKQDFLAVINKQYDQTNPHATFQNIQPHLIEFKPYNIKKYDNHYIPSTFDLRFNQTTTNSTQLSADITIETQDVHHDRIFIIYYWRYHVLSNGTITYGNTTEELHDKPQIIEFLSFKKPRIKWLT